MEELKRDNLFSGMFPVVTEGATISAGQTIKRGDVLVKNQESKNYEKATAVVTANDVVAIAAEDVITTEETAVTVVYKTGEFNSNKINFGGASTLEDNKDILESKSIYLKRVNE